jgi:hypothetical protein
MLTRTENNDQNTGNHRQSDNPIAIDQTITPVGELARQVAICGDQGCETGKICKGSICRQRENQQS